MNVIVADDHPFTLSGTVDYVSSLGYHVCGRCNDGVTALHAIKTWQPDIAILDINMPGLDGIAVAEQVQQQKLPTKVVLLTMHNERSIYKRATECGVYGYLLKNFSAEELEVCLLAVRTGEHYVSSHLEKELVYTVADEKEGLLVGLTLTERKVLELISQQKNTKQIATLLFSSEKTVEGHRRHIIEKLGLPKEKNSLLIWALENKGLFL